MTEKCRQSLALVNWSRVELLDAQAIYTLTVTCCRATKGPCFCGCHITELAPLVPAGNQAKAPTALDEMRALQEGAQLPSREDLLAEQRTARREYAALRAFHEVYVGSAEETVRQRDEAREALARVEAELKRTEANLATAVSDCDHVCNERDELKREREHGVNRKRLQDQREASLLDDIWEFTAEIRRRDAVIEAAREYVHTLSADAYPGLVKALFALDQAASGPECAQKGHAYATNKGECCIYCFRPKAECLHMGEPASEAEVTERVIVQESTWRYKAHNGALVMVKGVDERTVHMSWFDSGERKAWPIAAFREHFTWVSDPEATESAPGEG